MQSLAKNLIQRKRRVGNGLVFRRVLICTMCIYNTTDFQGAKRLDYVAEGNPFIKSS